LRPCTSRGMLLIAGSCTTTCTWSATIPAASSLAPCRCASRG